jgi:hypothetical protein
MVAKTPAIKRLEEEIWAQRYWARTLACGSDFTNESRVLAKVAMLKRKLASLKRKRAKT